MTFYGGFIQKFRAFLGQIADNFLERSKVVCIELMINKLHGVLPSGGLVSPSGGFASLFFDQVEYFASIKLCQALSRQGAVIKIPVTICYVHQLNNI